MRIAALTINGFRAWKHEVTLDLAARCCDYYRPERPRQDVAARRDHVVAHRVGTAAWQR